MEPSPRDFRRSALWKTAHPSGADPDLTYYGTLGKTVAPVAGFWDEGEGPPQPNEGSEGWPWMWSLGNQTEPVRVPLVSSFFFRSCKFTNMKHHVSPYQRWRFHPNLNLCRFSWFCQVPRRFIGTGARGFWLGHESTWVDSNLLAGIKQTNHMQFLNHGSGVALQPILGILKTKLVHLTDDEFCLVWGSSPSGPTCQVYQCIPSTLQCNQTCPRGYNHLLLELHQVTSPLKPY